MTTYHSDIEVGKKYRDEQTGIEGVATAAYFFQHGCERILIEYVHDGEIKELAFDAPRLVDIKTGKKAKTDKTGGPIKETGARRGPVVR